jgi:hypothetical protein
MLFFRNAADGLLDGMMSGGALMRSNPYILMTWKCRERIDEPVEGWLFRRMRIVGITMI